MIFSIIVPVCNGEKYIREAVDSALAQQVNSEDMFEIILSENGSSDGTPAICDEYAASNETVSVIHKGKIGLYQARQEGIKVSKGDYILALDADDKLVPGMLHKLADSIRDYEKKGQTPKLIFYNATELGGANKKLRDFSFERGKLYSGEDKIAFKELVLKGDYLNAMWIKCIHKSIALIDIERIGLNYGEDLLQTAEYIDRAEAIVYIDEILYYYRRNEESLTASYNRAFLDNQKIVWGEIDRIGEKWGLDDLVEIVDKRKSLTCAIAVAKIIYSGLSYKQKKSKLSELFSEDFYKRYFEISLPDGAPEEDVHVHALMTADCGKELYREAFVNTIKTAIKKTIAKAR
ncbi:MAG: glycosyltransferase family 2 protein [Butyrivibrio sp.]|nr:glycosyltransferase family 2 protein [Butyrivibrio sp.]